MKLILYLLNSYRGRGLNSAKSWWWAIWTVLELFKLISQNIYLYAIFSEWAVSKPQVTYRKVSWIDHLHFSGLFLCRTICFSTFFLLGVFRILKLFFLIFWKTYFYCASKSDIDPFNPYKGYSIAHFPNIWSPDTLKMVNDKKLGNWGSFFKALVIIVSNFASY